MYIPIRLLQYDFMLQTLLIVVNVCITLLIPFHWGIFFTLLYFQMYLGAAQLISALVHYFRPSPATVITQWRALHLVTSLCYLVVFTAVLVLNIDREDNEKYLKWIAFWCMLLAPQLIAYGYYYVMYVDYFSRKKYLGSRTV